MKVIKKINNNAAICLDDNNSELVAIGTGIGFPAVPYELKDLSVVQRTYYDVNSMYYELLNVLPEEILEVSTKIVDTFRMRMDGSISSNLIFTLADHIHFAVERLNRNIKIDTLLKYDIPHFYEKEYEMGREAVKIINRELKVRLPKEEAGNIALHLVNAGAVAENEKSQGYVDGVIHDIREIISKAFDIYIDKDTFNFSRFVSHIQYMLKREEKGAPVSSENWKLFEAIRDEYPKTYQCALKIKEYLGNELACDLNEEELLYLILHINRLCAREDCYRKSITPAENENP